MTHTRNKPNQQILDEAAEWFVECREGDLDSAGEKAFIQWLRRSPEHIAAYMEVAAFWSDVRNVAAKEDIDVQALIASARAEDNIVPLPAADHAARRAAGTRVSTPQLWRRGVLAACFVLALAIAGLSWHLTQGDIYSTEVGEQRSVRLNDGSTIELNAKSRLRVRFTDEVRTVELLEGQALFQVAKDPQRPFVVSSADANVRAVGTQFDVYQKRLGTIVTVIEGKVAVLDPSLPTADSAEALPSKGVEHLGGSGSGAILVSAGQQLVARLNTPAIPKPADVDAAIAWTHRQIVFQAAPLRDVVEEFNRYNPRQLELSDETLQSVRVSGVFSSTEPASFLRFLREQLHLEVTEDTDNIRIARK